MINLRGLEWMKILHYSLGFPPFRTGGMTKYCMDLMSEQVKMGHDVSLIWPGVYKDSSSNCSVKKHNKHNSIGSYEIINPLPVPLLDGIKETKIFMANKSTDVFKSFFLKNNFNVIHVHTLMGLPKELLEAAKEVGIKTVFTSHDYFGLCPRGSFAFVDHVCDCADSCEKCEICNNNALSERKIRLLQSPEYRIIKNSSIIKFLRKKQRANFKAQNISMKTDDLIISNPEKKLEYISLRSFYIQILQMFNVLHFNSTLTKEEFCKYGDFESKSRVINITHSAISNHKAIKQHPSEIINFSYLASCTARKGIYLLKDAFDKLYEKYPNNFILNIYTDCPIDAPYIHKHSNYTHSELGNVLCKADVVVLPSIWKETFGFTALEALSYAVPVVMTQNVGAKDLIVDGLSGFITKTTSEDLFNKLVRFIEEKDLSLKMNNYIVKNTDICDINQHNKEIERMYIDRCE